MPLRDLLPGGDTKAREAFEEVFSRDVLGAVVLGSAASKIVESLITIWVEGPTWDNINYAVGWVIVFPVGILIFVFWHDIAERASEAASGAAEKAADKAEEVSED